MRPSHSVPETTSSSRKTSIFVPLTVREDRTCPSCGSLHLVDFVAGARQTESDCPNCGHRFTSRITHDTNGLPEDSDDFDGWFERYRSRIH